MSWLWFDIFWGLLPAAGATLWGSQVCSALRFFSLRSKKLGLAFGHPAASLGRLQLQSFPLLKNKLNMGIFLA
nr:hypothetical protein [Saprospira grandis]